jgi:peptide deformylase
MVKNIIQIGNPILEAKSKQVDVKDSKMQELIEDLLNTCKAKESITAGLSAPQVGKNYCICICRRTDLEETSKEPIDPETLWEVLINPVIINKTKKGSTFWEGCLSIGEGPEGLYAPVTRSEEVVVEYLTRDGNKKQLKCKGFFSHVVQHELDHLNGYLFLKYVIDPKTIWKGKDLDKYYEENGDYPPV